MPGIAFLFKKRFHPARMDNQKKLFVAEQKITERQEREINFANEVKKEREIAEYESMNSSQGHDLRGSALKFMYSMPQSKNKNDNSSSSNNNSANSGNSFEPTLDANGDDPQVQLFKQKLLKKAQGNKEDEDNVNQIEYSAEIQQKNEEELYIKSHKNNHIAQSALERELGLKQRAAPTYEEQQQRHAFLHNAPIEGTYAKNMKVKHKPFNAIVRNVMCLRCGEWGHQSGDRECALKDHNPQDYVRQMREDPMSHMYRNSSSGNSRQNISSISADDGYESDPEAQFLASLSKREKKLLLIKLQVLFTYHFVVFS